MIPRPYQKRLVDRAEAALTAKGDTLAVAATGAGKTIMLALLAKRLGGRTLVVQHRQELVQQNKSKFLRVNPGARVSTFTADNKSFRGDAVFAMAQTLTRQMHRSPAFDVLILDEAHHAAAPTWLRIVQEARAKNPKLLVAGFTATPGRGDRKSLRKVFSNVCDSITIQELVGLGFLVHPRAFVVDVMGTQSMLRDLKGASDFGEQADVERILNSAKINAEVVREWREKANGRRTVVFCSTLTHARDVAEAFAAAGVRAAMVSGDMPDHERKATIKAFDSGRIDVLTNVMVLTEGFDSQPTSCVILLRKCSAKGTLIQMVGRGLRTVNAEDYPGVVKRDCVVLDFGTSLLTHGDLSAGGDLGEVEDDDDQAKVCPMSSEECDGRWMYPDRNGRGGCGAEIPPRSKECPMCGYIFERPEGEGGDGDETVVTRVSLTEMDILNASPFRYVDLFDTGLAMLAGGFSAWTGVFSPDQGGSWKAIGGAKDERGKVHQLIHGDRPQAFSAADDFMRTNETEGAVLKTRSWLDQPATDKQMQLLWNMGYGPVSLTKYEAACHATFRFNQPHIERALFV